MNWQLGSILFFVKGVPPLCLTLHAAKHIAICEPSLKGKQVRQYFLDCEKKAKATIDYSKPETLEEILRHLKQQIKHNENVVTTNGVKHA